MQGLLPSYTTRFDVVAAYYLIGYSYHSGKSSKGYRKLCQAMKHLGGNIDAIHHDEEFRCHAASLLRKRKRNIKRNW